MASNSAVPCIDRDAAGKGADISAGKICSVMKPPFVSPESTKPALRKVQPQTAMPRTSIGRTFFRSMKVIMPNRPAVPRNGRGLRRSPA